MKYLFLLLFLGCTLSYNASAESKRTVTTYYGTKSTGSGTNSCKGRTTRVCAVVEISDDYVSETTTLISHVLKDPNGKILSTDFEFVELPIKVVEEIQLLELYNLPNADVRVIKE